MNTRSLPRTGGYSPLDINARRILERARGETHGPAVLTSGEAKTAGGQIGGRIIWLGDMLTPDRNSFGTMRMVMAVLVLVSHAVFLTTGKVTAEPLFHWTGYTLGQHGVQVFFILSGILVAQSLFQSRSVTDYAVARSLRIFPALAVCVLLTALVLGPLLSALPASIYMRETWTAAYIVKTLTLSTGSAELPGLFQNNPVPRAVNTSVWTLKYEVACYAILALVGVVLLRVQAWRQGAAIMAGAWLLLAFLVPAGISAKGGDKNMLQVLHYFAIFFGTGVLAYALRRYIPVHAAILVPLGALLWLSIGTRFDVPVMAISLGYLSIWLATFRFGSLREYTNANDYSYATYLYHYPVSQAILHFAPDMHVLPLIGLTFGIVLLLAFLSWEFVERPALDLRHRFRSAPASKQSVRAVRTSVTMAAPEPSFDHALAAARAEPSLAAAAVMSKLRVWRPMGTRRPIAVMPDAPIISETATNMSAAQAERSTLQPQVRQATRAMFRVPAAASAIAPGVAPAVAPELPREPSAAEPNVLTAAKSTALAKQASTATEEQAAAVPTASISKSRLAMALSRPAQVPLEAAPQPTRSEPSRDIVPVGSDTTVSHRAMTGRRYRAADAPA